MCANFSWLFWTDGGTETIERIGVDGQGKKTIKNNIGNCVQALAIDFISQSLFWVDSCSYTLESIHIDGHQTSNIVQVVLHLGLKSQGLSILHNYLYWTESGGSGSIIKRLDRMTGEPVIEVSQQIRKVFGGVEVVQPTKQPDSKYM